MYIVKAYIRIYTSVVLYEASMWQCTNQWKRWQITLRCGGFRIGQNKLERQSIANTAVQEQLKVQKQLLLRINGKFNTPIVECTKLLYFGDIGVIMHDHLYRKCGVGETARGQQRHLTTNDIKDWTENKSLVGCMHAAQQGRTRESLQSKLWAQGGHWLIKFLWWP